jgi:hypothetical protein
MINEIDFLKKQVLILINLYNSKNFENVILKGKPLIKKFPDQIIFYNAVSLSLSAIGKHDEALKLLNDALKYDPNNFHVFSNIGLINTNINNFSVAREYLEKSLNINDKFIDAIINLSNLALKEKKTDEAQENLIKALKLSRSTQTDEIINLSLAQLNQQIGFFDEAIKYFKVVNKINQNNTAADRGISAVYKYKDENDEHYISMNKKLKNLKEESSLKNLYFALGKANEDLKKFKESFDFFQLGNKIANQNINYDLDEDKKLFFNIKKFFSNNETNLIKRCNKKFIFIVGMPRSGTTLVEQIISSHKNVYGAGELEFLSECLKEIIGDNKEFFDENSNKISLDKLTNIQKNYIKKTNMFNYNNDYLTDKAPLNFRWVGFIKLIFPNAKIIHCKRDGMDTCFSNYKNTFAGKSLPFTYDLKDIGNYYNLYKDLMDFWNNRYPKLIYNISYEKLVNNQLEETKKLIKHCDLNWDEACLRPEKNKKLVATASLSQVRSPIYKSSIKNWEYFSEELKELKNLIN